MQSISSVSFGRNSLAFLVVQAISQKWAKALRIARRNWNWNASDSLVGNFETRAETTLKYFLFTAAFPFFLAFLFPHSFSWTFVLFHSFPRSSSSSSGCIVFSLPDLFYLVPFLSLSPFFFLSFLQLYLSTVFTPERRREIKLYRLVPIARIYSLLLRRRSWITKSLARAQISCSLLLLYSHFSRGAAAETERRRKAKEEQERQRLRERKQCIGGISYRHALVKLSRL